MKLEKIRLLVAALALLDDSEDGHATIWVTDDWIDAARVVVMGLTGWAEERHDCDFATVWGYKAGGPVGRGRLDIHVRQRLRPLAPGEIERVEAVHAPVAAAVATTEHEPAPGWEQRVRNAARVP